MLHDAIYILDTHSGALPFIPFTNREESFQQEPDSSLVSSFFLLCPCDPETSWLIVFWLCCFSLTFVCIALFSLNEMARDASFKQKEGCWQC
jgi:hypothetical protein